MNIKIVKSAKELQDAYHVRSRVFVTEQGVPKELEIDDLENAAIHFVGYQNGKAIAASRMRTVDGYAKLERVCVLKEFRGNGYGRDMIFFMENVAKEKGIEKSKLNGQTQVEIFYQHLGYKTISSEFMDAGIPHVTMTKPLN